MNTASGVACSHSMSWVRYCKLSSLVSRSLCHFLLSYDGRLGCRFLVANPYRQRCSGEVARVGSCFSPRVLDQFRRAGSLPLSFFALINPSVIKFLLQTAYNGMRRRKLP